MAIHTTYISLYTGSAMLDEGFRQGLAGLGIPEPKPVCYVERDIEAGALLVDKILSGQLVQAPVWTDSDTFDCKPFVGKVDAIIGGFPCQPWSLAGTRKGSKDKRWLWDHIRRITEEVRPSFLFLENVPGLISGGGLNKILEDFITLGYDTEWISIRAAHVGAPHRRERVFILAHTGDKGLERLARNDQVGKREVRKNVTDDRNEIRGGIGRSRGELDDSKHDGRTSSEEPKGAGQGILDGQEGQESTEQPTGPSERASGTGSMAHADGDGLVGREKPRSTGQGGYDKKKRKERTGYVGGQGKRMVRTGNVDDPNIEGLERRNGWERRGSDEFSFVTPSSEAYDKQPVRETRPLPWPPRPDDTTWDNVIKYRPDLAPAMENTSWFGRRRRDDGLRPDEEGKESGTHEAGGPSGKQEATEPEVRGVADGMAGGLGTLQRTGLLRVLGNGVVPQQAATALTILYERMNDGR